MRIVEREAKTATGLSGMYFRIFMGLHQVVVIYGPVRPDSYGVITLIEVETLSVELLFVNIDQKDAHAHTSLYQTFITLPIAIAHLQQSTPTAPASRSCHLPISSLTMQ
jgi:hypothetical protein